MPISASDIIAALKQVKEWSALAGLPKRVAELEARVKALEENRGAHVGPSPTDCPKCGARMRVKREDPHPTFDFAGLKVHVLKCDGCGNMATRNYKPGTGYE